MQGHLPISCDPLRAVGAAVGVAAGVAVPLLCGGDGLSAQANCALGILVGAIAWWACRVLPEYATALLMAVLLVAVAGVPTATVLSAFATPTWWLLLAAFGLGLGMRESGLLRRMALAVLRAFPRTYRAQVLGLLAAGTLIGPLVPSMAVKAAMLAPLSLGISDSLGYERKSRAAEGLFLAMFTGIRNVAPAVVSASIIGYAILGLLPPEVQARFDMLHWLLAMLPWFAVVSLLNYLAIMARYAPGPGREWRERAGGAPGEGASLAGASASVAEDPLGSRPPADASASAPSTSEEPPGHDEPAVPVASRPGATAQEGGAQDPGPLSPKERRMAVIMACCVALWVSEPLHGIASHVVALAALVATIACGVFTKEDFRQGIAWDSLVFIGVAFGLADVFASLGIDEWVVALCGPPMEALAANPFLFVLGIGATTVALRFLIVSETPFANLFMVLMVPIAMAAGISPWVVGATVYAMVSPWFVPYQNVIYLTARSAAGGEMVRQAEMARYCGLYLAISMAGLLASVPYWQWLGLFG